jgi:hypothetical protein
MYQNFSITYLYEAQHVSGDTTPIIRSLKLHLQPLVFRTWIVVGRVVGGRCQAQCATSNNLPRMKNQTLQVQF